jgi:hypothetical protein
MSARIAPIHSEASLEGAGAKPDQLFWWKRSLSDNMNFFVSGTQSYMIRHP